MKRIFHLLFVIILVFPFFEGKAEVKLPALFSDNMVLQQQTTVRIWGKANPSETVIITPSWNKKKYTTQTDGDGKWLVEIKTPKASTGEFLIIKGENTLTINNILIGEVWLCSGQSNMDFPIAKTKGWRTGIIDEEKEMKDADYPEIRFFHVAQKLSPKQELDDCEGKWMITSVENLKDFSAVAFFFGRELYNNLKTPIGLIQSTWGGTHAESWTKMSVMQNDPIYAELLKEEQEKPLGTSNNKTLSTLWNGMIHPLVPYTIKGVIWYQGESNSIRHQDYTQVFTNMINGWREEWKQGCFPFYFVQIAPHYKQPPEIREAQLKTWQTVKNTGMVVITDAGDSTDIHPRNKQIPGKRLAKWALAKDYKKKLAFSGPIYKTMKIKANEAVLSFIYTDGGLTATDGELTGFFIAGEDRQFHPAIASIRKDKVVVYSPEVQNPVAVRYGWDNFFRVNLYNKAGLPASPFRTDNWK